MRANRANGQPYLIPIPQELPVMVTGITGCTLQGLAWCFSLGNQPSDASGWISTDDPGLSHSISTFFGLWVKTSQTPGTLCALFFSVIAGTAVPQNMVFFICSSVGDPSPCSFSAPVRLRWRSVPGTTIPTWTRRVRCCGPSRRSLLVMGPLGVDGLIGWSHKMVVPLGYHREWDMNGILVKVPSGLIKHG